jgi:hypothetical protein
MGNFFTLFSLINAKIEKIINTKILFIFFLRKTYLKSF